MVRGSQGTDRQSHGTRKHTDQISSNIPPSRAPKNDFSFINPQLYTVSIVVVKSERQDM